MGNVTVIGGQWGDEGKGKVIDWLADRADVVVRFQGGNNAGHTIVVGDKTYKLSLLPSGVVQGKLSIIGNGVVVDPWSLMDEIGRARAQGLTITPDVLVLADNATVILPLHRDLDQAREAVASWAEDYNTTRPHSSLAHETHGHSLRSSLQWAGLLNPPNRECSMTGPSKISDQISEAIGMLQWLEFQSAIFALSTP